jgi:hypothetical protein
MQDKIESILRNRVDVAEKTLATVSLKISQSRSALNFTGDNASSS